ncbi:undecaprenyl-diphosphate phosphatase [Caproiciproducens galactitolivorans]|uniref:Undecaprenyl-diphosphatase n=1 Tax=Caproiciproducens galactitolivorans TaxID=642589 RepID=A0A4Z0Y0N1_9FIRM|nr:undecaprenyl-diphosphate phosphatase [Caproiciproducens galactitolivorans]QEY35708.1 undecaprenyl-diphosphate phosphatase [Caproiciproducens galactitolivorans]TGJ77439.1 undecaprenyl-diphosphatase [Caproiciproducens galactitolivorans]
MGIVEILKAILFGIVEGITEWLPISSTGHMILLDDFVKLNTSATFKAMFLVVIQFGAILAVIVIYWKNLMPFGFQKRLTVKTDILSMWGKIIVACIPAAIVGLLWDEEIEAFFYNYRTVSIMLILFGILFIIIENYNRNKQPKISAISQISYKTALIIGLFQLIAAIFPGTSRSGATIVGALLIGVARTTAAEFTFYLAVPVMFGASVLKLAKFGFHYTGVEVSILLTGMVVAFVVSVLIIKFLMNYIKKHDFKVFGWYRIALGSIILLYFAVKSF